MKWLSIVTILCISLHAQSFSDSFIQVSADLSAAYSQLSQVNQEIQETESLITAALSDIGAYSDKAYPNYWSTLKSLKAQRSGLESQISSLESQLDSIIEQQNSVSTPNPTNSTENGPLIQPNSVPNLPPIQVSPPVTTIVTNVTPRFDFGFGEGGGGGGAGN
ncbi:hypothetical protein [Candidatus Uabimicrobium sp. HlEnr_7]|uniref:hypothetical protein n=1 Tax=Candidatus Uabimicrobium helgolandensis TaxID=3095367 RepID=UPI00355717AA